jgi:hypothetical protein
MLTQAHQHTTPTTTHDSISIGSTLKQNIAERLPVINTQVKKTFLYKLIKIKKCFYFHRQFH